MEKFLGILFCGGRGVRLGEITRFISKSFLPIYDRPVFRYGLDLLESANCIDEILILSNHDNNQELEKLGYPTIIQNDDVVFDMFSGWEFIKKVTGTQKNAVLVPSDNVTDISVDQLVECFTEKKAHLVFSLYPVPDRQKLSQMGCYDLDAREFYYKHPDPPTEFGVIAPYVVSHSLQTGSGDHILNHPNAAVHLHNGYWFDIGDYDSIIEAAAFIKSRKTEEI